MNIPHGFRTVTFAEYLASIVPPRDGAPVDLTNDEMVRVVEEVLSVSSHEASSTIRDLEAKHLISFAVAEDGEPAVFIAPDSAFERAEDLMAAHALLRYFDTTGAYDHGTTEMIISVDTWAAKSQSVLRGMSEDLHLSPRVILAALHRFEDRGWLTILNSTGGKNSGYYLRITATRGDDIQPSDMRIIDAISRLYGLVNNSRISLAPAKTYASADYMRAVEAQYEMLAFNERLVKSVASTANHPHKHALKEWIVTSEMLRTANTYCWFHDPEVAVQAAAATLPTSFKLGRENVPTQAGFWYFVDALSIQTVTEDNPIKALLWSWTSHTYETEFGTVDRFGLIIEAVIEDTKNGVMIPTVRFFWREGLTLEQMMTNQHAEFVAKYTDDPKVLERLRLNLIAMEYMARFFAAGSLWLQQRVLTATPAVIERHFRKRVIKQHNLTAPLKEMSIIQLRRRQAVSEAAPGSSKAVDWKCRWTVTGHWRNQPYKTTGKIEAIWIDAYVKGPDDKPVKEAPRKVFAVKR